MMRKGQGAPDDPARQQSVRPVWSDFAASHEPADRPGIGNIPAVPGDARPTPTGYRSGEAPASVGAAPGRVGDPAMRRRRTGLRAGKLVAVALSVAVFVGWALVWGFAATATTAVASSSGVSNAGETGVLFRGGLNILLVGSDSRTDQLGNPLTASELADVSTQADGGGVNTDTIMVVHIPPGGGRATAVSLPRDTWIPRSVATTVKGPYSDGTLGVYKPNKINSFYGAAKFYTEQHLATSVPDGPARTRASDEAGRAMLIRIVQGFTGLKIDHYAEVNLIGFYQLSLALGGVPVCLNHAVNDPYSGADFKAGPQEVSGKAATAFVRQRHGLPQGDLDRVRRQQAFLAGATSKMLSVGTLTSPAKLAALLTAASKSLVLDNGFDLLSFAGQLADLSGGNVTFQTMPTHGADAAHPDALATDPAEIKTFFAALDRPAAAPAPMPVVPAPSLKLSSVTVDVQNATDTARVAATVADSLIAAGFTRGQITDFPGITAASQHAGTIIAYPVGGQAAAAAVSTVLHGKGHPRQDASIPPGHILIIAGQDLTAPTPANPAPAPRPTPTAVAPAPAPPGPSASAITAHTVGCVN
jgi:LCP family protein required for cell wall assembly